MFFDYFVNNSYVYIFILKSGLLLGKDILVKIFLFFLI